MNVPLIERVAWESRCVWALRQRWNCLPPSYIYTKRLAISKEIVEQVVSGLDVMLSLVEEESRLRLAKEF